MSADHDPQNVTFAAALKRRTPRMSSSLRVIAAILFEQKGLFAICMALLLLSSLAMVLGPVIIGRIVDLVRGGDRGMLRWFALLFLTIEAVRLAASAAHSYFTARLGQRSLHILRGRVFAHIEKLPMALHDRAKTGELMTFLSNDVQALSEMFSAGFMTVIEKLFVVIFTAVSLILLSPTLAFFGLGLFALLFVVSTFFTGWLRTSYRLLRRAFSEFNSVLSENIDGAEVTRINAFEAHRMDEYRRLNEGLRRAQLTPIKVVGIFHPLVTLVNCFSIAALAYFGGRLVVAGEISLGVLVAAFGYVLWLFWPIIIIVDRWNTFLNGLSATERLAGLLSLDIERTAGVSAPPKETLRGDIVFENVWFAYEGERWIFRDLSLHIPAGMRVAFFGPTGSGKTTLTALLLRLYEPQRGRIVIDGIDIRSIELSELRRLFGVVQQDAVLYQGTIGENIRLFDPVTSARFADSPFDLERDTARTLSMGERQILAFERARYVRPALWILDEATAHLDPALDRELESALLKESVGRTTIIIAHRLSSLSLVDRIYVLSKGVLIEQGSHQELTRRGGFYARYVLLQEKLAGESA